jgi:hypothetical protein
MGLASLTVIQRFLCMTMTKLVLSKIVTKRALSSWQKEADNDKVIKTVIEF